MTGIPVREVWATSSEKRGLGHIIPRLYLQPCCVITAQVHWRDSTNARCTRRESGGKGAASVKLLKLRSANTPPPPLPHPSSLSLSLSPTSSFPHPIPISRSSPPSLPRSIPPTSSVPLSCRVERCFPDISRKKPPRTLMVLKGVLRDVHVFAFIYHKCSPALSLRLNGTSWREGGKRRGGKGPTNKKIIIKEGGKMKNCLTRTVFGYSVTLNYGEGFFRWSEYYLIPMMELKARKKRKLSAEPVGKTHRCISRYIRALGEKHETSTAFNSIHTSVAPSRSPSLSLSFSDLSRRFLKSKYIKSSPSSGAVSGGGDGSAQKTHSCASSAACQNVRG